MRSLFFLILSSLASLPAQAAAYTYSTSVDLSSPVITTSLSTATYTFNLSSQPSFQFNTGDTLSGTVLFDQPVEFTDASMANPVQLFALDLKTPTSGALISSSQSIQLLGVSGSLIISNPQSGSDTGKELSITDVASPAFTNSSVTFTGFTYSLAVTSAAPAGASYTPDLLEFAASIGDFLVIPEPPLWQLLLGGLGVLGIFTLRRRCLIPIQL